MLTTFTFIAFLAILGGGFGDHEFKTWSSQKILENEKETIEIEKKGNFETVEEEQNKLTARRIELPNDGNIAQYGYRLVPHCAICDVLAQYGYQPGPHCATCDVLFCSAGGGRRCYSSPSCCLNTRCWRVPGFRMWCLKNGYLDYI